MDRNEKLFIALAVIALAAVVLFKIKQPVNPAEKPIDGSPDSIPAPQGPEYLTYNQPYGFGPPLQNVLPNLASGVIAPQNMNEYNYTASCGCGGSNAVH